MDTSTIFETVIALAIIIGASFALVGSIGLVRLADVYCRLHGPTKATTLGIGGLLVGSVLHFSRAGNPSLHEILVTAFLFLTAPVSAHMLARAALHLRVTNVTAPLAPEDRDSFPETGTPDSDLGSATEAGTAES